MAGHCLAWEVSAIILHPNTNGRWVLNKLPKDHRFLSLHQSGQWLLSALRASICIRFSYCMNVHVVQISPMNFELALPGEILWVESDLNICLICFALHLSTASWGLEMDPATVFVTTSIVAYSRRVLSKFSEYLSWWCIFKKLVSGLKAKRDTENRRVVADFSA